ncbi:hypothetical protein RUM44_006802 [Polyplax serrata]|uniref:SCA7 domain-containing protein n=1 Tax=Polyplax serrata TaxID=468196 RepID=A0ABR1AJ33_POLSC
MTAQVDGYKHENNAATHLIGQDWQKLIDLIESRPGDGETKSFDGGGYEYRAEDNVLRTLHDVKRLRQKDMPMFGRCPETDNFYTVVCSSCSMILMPHALKDHYEKRHGNGNKSQSPSDRQSLESLSKLKSKKIQLLKTDKVDKCKKIKPGALPVVELTEEALKDAKRLDKLKKGKSMEKLVEADYGNLQKSDRGKQKCVTKGIADLQPVVALSPIQVIETELEPNDARELPKNKKRDKKKSDRKPDKVYDPDKHCGVINDSGKPCVRSILCKVHQVALKRAVLRRTMPYDVLIRLMKTQNEDEKMKPENGSIRPPKGETEEKVPQEVKELRNGDVQTSRGWMAGQISIKIEEPPTKRLKIKDEIVDDEIDQNQFTLPSHLEALIDETLKTLKDVDEGESLPIAPIVPKPEPLLKWNLEKETTRKSPSPPPPLFLDDIHWHSSHPKPLATNTFGCRLIGGLMSTCKKLDTLRKHLQSVWSATSVSSPTSIRTGFNDVFNSTGSVQGPPPTNVSAKNNFSLSKYPKKPNQNKTLKKNVTQLVSKTPVASKRKRRSNSNLISPVQNSTANASDIISGLLISNSVPVQRTVSSSSSSSSVPTIPTGVIPVNSITSNGVPLRLFQGSLPVIASAAPNQPATFIQLNLCSPK